MNTKASISRLLATDKAQSVKWEVGGEGQQPYAYSPYGYRSPRPGLANPPGFNGERFDPLTGNYHLGNGYRAYSPQLMRFTRPDSNSPFAEGGLNCYCYCMGDPVNRVDPNGRIPRLPKFSSASFPQVHTYGRRPQKSTRYQIMSVEEETIVRFPEMSDLRFHGTDSLSFGDGSIFYISSHGGKDGSTHLGSGASKALSPSQLYGQLLDEGVDFTKYKEVVFLSCYSGRGQDSAAAQFAGIAGMPTSGTVGMRADNGDFAWEETRKFASPNEVLAEIRRGYSYTVKYSNNMPADENQRLQNVQKFKFRRFLP